MLWFAKHFKGQKMTPQDFISKWRANELKERSAAQSHFNDLCRLLGLDDPTTADPRGDWFAFEKGAAKTSGGEGWADVWRKDCFAWEYKGRHKDLDAAFRQLLNYAVALENPPLLIASDMDRIVIRTHWTNTVQQETTLTLDDLRDAAKRDLLRAAFTDPERLKPQKTRQSLTEDAAGRFVALAQRLRDRGHPPQAVAHFVNRLVFCMFAQNVRLLPDGYFVKLLDAARLDPTRFEGYARTLFAAMRTGGLVGFDQIDWFNGGLFDDDSALPLDRADLADLLAAARLDWSQIDPSILGTLFERGLDPAKRSQLGAHYTDRDKIMKIIGPVVIEPLLAEWAEVRGAIEGKLAKAPRETKEMLLRGPQLAARTKAIKDCADLRHGFLVRLRAFRVLDPACGSGNFLYLALRALKDIEHRVNVEAEALGLPRSFPSVGPEAVKGIELNPYAAELARVSVWIGEIQWMRANGYEAGRNPILRPLDTIECRDAILNADGTEANWPEADAIIGNPPFLGAKLMKRALGPAETDRIRFAFQGRLPGFTDLVCYWFERARKEICAGRAKRAGFVATNSIAKNTNLPVLRRIADDLVIFEAWSDEPWVLDGAAVRVAMICFADRKSLPPVLRLNGVPIDAINPNLTLGVDLSQAQALAENRGRSLLGIQKSGPFDIDGTVARSWLALPLNPNGRPNSDVLRPYWNGDDVTSRPRDVWFIDLPRGQSEAAVSLFEAPFNHLAASSYDPATPGAGTLQIARSEARDEHARRYWWEPYWSRPEMRRQISAISRYIVTPETPTHIMFKWLSNHILPDKNLIVIPRDDDTFFGILHSKIHLLWVRALGSPYGNHPTARRYNSSRVFDTFPFPEGLTPDRPATAYAKNPHAQTIAAAAAELDRLREAWLNPPDLVRREPEVVSGYPDRLLPVNEAAAAVLKKRTLTNLYNARPAWLDHAHARLDAAVAEAYGWGDVWRAGNLTDDEILARLFQLNQERTSAGKPAVRQMAS